MIVIQTVKIYLIIKDLCAKYDLIEAQDYCKISDGNGRYIHTVVSFLNILEVNQTIRNT